MEKLDRLGWAASSTYEIGPYHIGVRSDSTWLDGVIRSALERYHVPGLEAPANFSVSIPQDAPGSPAKSLNMLYEGHTNLVRSRNPARALGALFRHLAKHQPTDAASLTRISDLGLVRDGRAILVPRGVMTWLDLLAPPLNRAGWQFVDEPWSLVDLESAELVVRQPTLHIDSGWRAEVSSAQSKREPAPVVPGRYPLVGWGVYSTEATVMSRAAGVAAAAAKIFNPAEDDVRETLGTLVGLSEHLRVTGLGSPYDGDFASRLLAIDVS